MARKRIREFHQMARTGKTKLWRITVDNDLVIIEHGLLDGALQKTSRHGEAKNIGRSNETTPEEDAQKWADRQILMKERQGYVEVDRKTGFAKGKNRDTVTIEEINFKENLPENLRFYKPQNSMNAYMQKKMDDHDAWWLRKRDGNMHIICINSAYQATMYSSTLQMTQKDEAGGGHSSKPIYLFMRYPQIYEELNQLGLPKNTILLGEICTTAAGGWVDDEGFDVDDLDYVNGVRGALTSTSLATQEEHGKLGFCVWDIAFWEGECWLTTKTPRERFMHLVETFQDATWFTYPEIAHAVSDKEIFVASKPGNFSIELLKGETFEKVLMTLAKQQGWEGYVVVDPEVPYDNRAYNFRGKAERPKTCCKLKPKLEADFIVWWDPKKGIGKEGKGKKSGGVGSVQAGLFDPRTDEFIDVGLVGGGLTDEDVTRFADPELYPMVWQVEFASWTKSGSLQFPEFIRVRDDKKPEECEIYQNPDWEKHYGEVD